MPVVHAEPGRRRPGAVLALALTLAASPAAGDWLVTREGAHVETRGPWKVKGKQVVFSDPDGDLVSLRLADVDLEASERATREAVEAEEARKREAEAPPPRRKSVRVVTDADVKPAAPAVPETEAEGGKADDEKAAAPAKPVAGGSVAVSTWQRRELPGKAGIEVVGELSNNSQEIATDVQVTVALYDEDKRVLATGAAILDAPSLRPGESVKFRAPFEGIFGFSQAGFDVQSWGLKLKARPTTEESAEPADTPP